VFVRYCYGPVLGLMVFVFSTGAWAADHVAPGGEHAGTGEHAKEHGGHPDSYDLSHADASKSLIDPKELKADLAIYTFIVFVLLLAILAKFAWGPIVAGLDKREQSIADKIDEARRLSEEAKGQLDQYNAQLAGAADEVRQVLDEGRRDADVLKQQVLDDAQKAAQAEKDRALREIAAAKNQALTELAQTSVDAAVDLAGRILRRQLTEDDHAELIRQALKQFPSKN